MNIFGKARFDEQLKAVSEREWLIPCAAMTALLGLAAVALMPAAGYVEVPPYLSRVGQWMIWGLTGGMTWLLVHVLKLRRSGVTRPIARLSEEFLLHRTRLAAAVVGLALAGIDMLFFMWIKPEITAISPFWADELYADLDMAIFGRDPWRFFQGMDLTFHAWSYSFFWMVAMVATLIWLFAQPPSRPRSAALINYFALWSIFGPIGQYFGSAAGPIFFQKIGLGDRFAELSDNVPPITNGLSQYLWELHVGHVPAVGAGISAMPSLHIALVAWIYLAFQRLGSKIAMLAVLFAIYIFLLSVALGWHYAIDGAAGALGALLFQRISEFYLDRRSGRSVLGAPAIAR